MTREILFSVTAKDCRWDYFRGTGKGGQKRNKTSSGVRCTHTASGAVGVSDDTRSQHQNKRTAFERMIETDKFKTWHKLEIARHTGAIAELEARVDRQMNITNLKEEVLHDGRWESFYTQHVNSKPV